MADQELLDDVLEAHEEAGSPAENPELRTALEFQQYRSAIPMPPGQSRTWCA